MYFLIFEHCIRGNTTQQFRCSKCQGSLRKTCAYGRRNWAVQCAAGAECINDPQEDCKVSSPGVEGERCSQCGFKYSNEELLPNSAEFLFSKWSRTMVISWRFLVGMVMGGEDSAVGRERCIAFLLRGRKTGGSEDLEESDSGDEKRVARVPSRRPWR
jgi:hypothetical protein